jgi:hypothetical protein
MKSVVLSEEEALAVLRALRTNWIQINDQKVIFNLISKIEKELGLE